MTMVDEQMKVPVKVPVESVVDVEAVYGRELLDEVAAFTADLARRRDDLRAFMIRATRLTSTISAAEDRLEAPHEAQDEAWQVFNVLSGVKALSDLAGEVGLHDAIFESTGPDGDVDPARDAAKGFRSVPDGEAEATPPGAASALPAGTLDAFAPIEVRRGWLDLAKELEQRQADLADLIGQLQESYAAHEVAMYQAFDRHEATWTDALDNSLREASGFGRLSEAVNAAKLWPAVEDRNRTPEELQLIEQGIAKMRGES